MKIQTCNPPQDCAKVTLERPAPENDSDDVDAPEVKCELCAITPGGPSNPDPVFTPGDEICFCVSYDPPLGTSVPDGVCFYDVTQMNLVIFDENGDPIYNIDLLGQGLPGAFGFLTPVDGGDNYISCSDDNPLGVKSKFPILLG